MRSQPPVDTSAPESPAPTPADDSGQPDRRGTLGQRVATLEDRVEHGLDAVKPKLRGWLHLGAFPASLAAGIVLVTLSPTTAARVSCAVFAASAALLFGVSALYHRGRWSPTVTTLLKRFDHANIFLIIAGTYTPFSALLLPANQAEVLLWIIWTCAVVGVLFQVFWINAPRWLYVPVYVAMGWVAVAYIPNFLRGGGVAILVLMVVGGALYTLGGLVYGIKRPDPSPRWFGFHEVFHALTIVAFITHYVGISLAVY